MVWKSEFLWNEDPAFFPGDSSHPLSVCLSFLVCVRGGLWCVEEEEGSWWGSKAVGRAVESRLCCCLRTPGPWRVGPRQWTMDTSVRLRV